MDSFGADRVVVRDFAEILRGQEQFIEDFLRVCDPMARPQVHFGSRRNTSVSSRAWTLRW